MAHAQDAPLPAPPRALSAVLNDECACETLDRAALEAALDAAQGAPLSAAHAHLVSPSPVFLAAADAAAIGRVIDAVEAAARLPLWRAATLPEEGAARTDFGPAGVFMGYDFHLGADGPKLIEINTNAGGAFVNAALARAQRACCDEAGVLKTVGPADFEGAVIAMFRDEWRRQRGAAPFNRIAIVDDAPEEQYLYPDFLLARRLFESAGIDAPIVDAGALVYENGALYAGGGKVDLVYNRLVDFRLEEPRHAALARAYAAGDVVVTPSPRHHALYADKRNLVLLSDPARLAGFGLEDAHIAALATLPAAHLVEPENADAFWAARKRYFFKPADGYGGKAVYRGDKLTRTVWADIARGGYVAQEVAAPGARAIGGDGAPRKLKTDIRFYAWRGRPLIAAARLYQGQTTNFRTPGGGFAPVYLV